MSIGTGIGLFVIGAILAFALNFQVAAINIHLIGYILMAAGVVVFILGLVFTLRGRQTTSSTTIDPATGRQVTRRRDAGDL
ncbi:DUF6458 family protein [Frondihabitans australicus]|uniref:DUF6458 domain-containing protein n=1 Tax=Frondihabitans australicus TaxID=386892 RepID=A0A495ICG1_9MICO|nr:DUF6458 family protein [Frondihabitans australicus]RKR73632.1 hypothetical protein C8E83_0725 [Frondihabitans australicus]